jgi:hypothetical protein
VEGNTNDVDYNQIKEKKEKKFRHTRQEYIKMGEIAKLVCD